MEFKKLYPCLTALIGIIFVYFTLKSTTFTLPSPLLMNFTSLPTQSTSMMDSIGLSRDSTNSLYIWNIKDSQVALYSVQNENLKEMSVSKIHGSSLLYKYHSPSNSLNILSSKLNEESLDYHFARMNFESFPHSYSLEGCKMFGSLAFSRIESNQEYLLYSRSKDSKIFRILDLKECFGRLNYPNKSALAGPTYKDYPGGRPLALKLLYSPSGSISVFVIRYQSYKESPVFTISFNIFYINSSDDQEKGLWNCQTLWESTLSGVEDDYITIQESYRLHFLTTPVLGESNDGKVIVFSFLHKIFTLHYTLDYAYGSSLGVDDESKERKNEQSHGHGYKLIKQPLTLSNIKLEAKEYILRDNWMIVVSESNLVYFFHWVSSSSSYPTSWYSSTYQSLMSTNGQDSQNGGGGNVFWNLDKVWDSRLVPTLLDKSIKSIITLNESHLALLYDGNHLVLLDYMSKDSRRISLWTLIQTRFDIFFILFVVVLFFTMNELRIVNDSPRLWNTHPAFIAPLIIYILLTILFSIL